MWQCSCTLVAAGLCLSLHGGELPPVLAAKMVKVVADASSQGKVALSDVTLKKELIKLGATIDEGAKVVWVSSKAEAAKYAKSQKIVLCGQLDLIGQGAAVALVDEGGRPTVYISPAAVKEHQVTLPDVLIKVGKVAK